MHKTFTQTMYEALANAGATSHNTGLTSNEITSRLGLTSRADKKFASTVLGNLARKKLANRSLEVIREGERREYRYWLVKSTGQKSFRMATSHRLPAVAATPVSETTSGSGKVTVYLMTITGPNHFQAFAEIPAEKLTRVIAAANGG